MTTYELTVILPTDKEKAVFDKIKKLLDTAGAKITKTDEWGKRTLAYPINKQTEAVYYILTVDMETDKTNAVARVLQNDDDVLRHLLVVASKTAFAKGSVESKKVAEKVEKIVKKSVESKSKSGTSIKSTKGTKGKTK